MICNFDLAAIKDKDYSVDPRSYKLKQPREVIICHSEDQKNMIKGYTNQYGTTLDGLGRILMRVNPLKILFRQIKGEDSRLHHAAIKAPKAERIPIYQV